MFSVDLNKTEINRADLWSMFICVACVYCSREIYLCLDVNVEGVSARDVSYYAKVYYMQLVIYATCICFDIDWHKVRYCALTDTSIWDLNNNLHHLARIAYMRAAINLNAVIQIF